MASWLHRVRHDLVKRLVWPARDRLDIGGALAPGELAITLTDAEGNAIAAAALWALLRIDAPAAVPPAVLDAFGAAVDGAVAAAAAGDPQGVVALDAAFEALAQIVKQPPSH